MLLVAGCLLQGSGDGRWLPWLLVHVLLDVAVLTLDAAAMRRAAFAL